MRTLGLDATPVRDPHTTVESAGQDHIFHHQLHGDVVLNPTAFALWELCDGHTTVREMLDAVCDLFAVSPQQAEQDVSNALSSMREVGIIR